MTPPADLSTREARDEPTNSSAAAILANQFGTSCNRLLIVHDDMVGKGLGWTVRNWQVAMLAAAQSGRVLHEAAAPQGNKSQDAREFVPYRWCLQPPFTLECFYQRWNDCDDTPPVPQYRNLTHHRQGHGWGIIGLTGPRHANLPIIHMELSEFIPERWTPRGADFGPADVTRFMFRPRQWVRDIGDCILERAGIRSGSRRHATTSTLTPQSPFARRSSRPDPYAVIFVRDSAEKRAELRSHGHGWTSARTYFELTVALTTNLLPAPRVVLQTSSLSAYAQFEAAAKAHSPALRFGVSDNPRSDHDSWGGLRTGEQTAEGTVAAVNLHLAAEAAFFVGLASSAWTHLVHLLMAGGIGQPMISLCCNCGSRDHYAAAFDKGQDHLNGTEGKKSNIILLRAPQPAGRGVSTRLEQRALSDLSHVRSCELGPVPLHAVGPAAPDSFLSV